MQQIKIKDKIIGENAPMMIIAEIASPHEGDFDNLLKLIDIAKAAGVDAVKFQVFKADSNMTPFHDLYDLAKKFEFTPKQWDYAVKYTKENSDLLVLTDISDDLSIETVRALNVDMVKIHSADLNNFTLVKKIANLNIPTLIGIGASTLDEITECITVFKSENKNCFIALMHGYQAFPTKLEELNILQIRMLKNLFKLPVGFLDHTEGNTEESLFIPLVARGVGAFAIEKHIVLDRSKKGIDYESALSLNFLKKLVRQVRQAELALGSSVPTLLTSSGIKYREFMKKIIVTARNIEPNETINLDMLAFKRSLPGFFPGQLKYIIGKKAKVRINKDQNIAWEMLKNE